MPSNSKDNLRAEFEKLACDWERNRPRYSSVIRDIVIVEEYQRIIGMGRDVVPLILERMQNKPDHWFWALRTITGECPIPEEARGNLGQMTAAWLEWGVENGLIEPEEQANP